MISAESDIAGKIARKGLKIVDKMLDKMADLAEMECKAWPQNFARNITDCVIAAVKVQAEERAQAEFEKENRLTPEDVRGLIKEYLAALPPVDMLAFFAEVRGPQPTAQNAIEGKASP
jgi:hypothetical protein